MLGVLDCRTSELAQCCVLWARDGIFDKSLKSLLGVRDGGLLLSFAEVLRRVVDLRVLAIQ